MIGTILEKYASQFNMGYDAAEGVYCDMIEKGILDPVKVVSIEMDYSGLAFRNSFVLMPMFPPFIYRSELPLWMLRVSLPS